MGVPSQLLTGKDNTGTSQNKMKAFVAVFAGVAAASAAPKTDPWLVAHPAVYLGDAHTLRLLRAANPSRSPLSLESTSLASARLNPTMDWAMVMGAMAMVAICIERGQQRLRPSPTMAMEASVVMEAMVMEAMAPMERGLLRPSPTMDWAMVMGAMAM